MSSFSIWHWIIILIMLIPLWMFSKVIAKAGYSAWWALIGVVPLVNLIALWVFAFSKWPAAPDR